MLKTHSTQVPGQIAYTHLQHTGKVFYHRPPVDQKGGAKKRWSTFKDMSEQYTHLPQGRSNVF